MDELGIDEAECSRKVASGKRVADAIRTLINARSLLHECARVLHELLLVPVLMYGSETMIWREKRSRIRAIQMDRGLLGIRRIDKVPNAVSKGVDEKFDEGVLRWFNHVERIENDRIAKKSM